MFHDACTLLDILDFYTQVAFREESILFFFSEMIINCRTVFAVPSPLSDTFLCCLTVKLVLLRSL